MSPRSQSSAGLHSTPASGGAQRATLSPREQTMRIQADAARIHALGNELRYILDERPVCACGAIAAWDGEVCFACRDLERIDAELFARFGGDA